MSLYSEPPPLRTPDDDKPTLLVCWWITAFCAVIIVIRVLGRFIRTEELFREDKTAALALVPLFLRMGCVHYILVHGTNNADFHGLTLTDEQVRTKSISSGLVLASRLLYSLTLWIFKITIVEFFKRLTDVTWERTYRTALNYIWAAILASFVAVLISDLAECQPFSHYWQVLPDPGPQCRQGYAHLLTLAVCNVLTDLLLVFFPIPIILRSAMPLKRKFQLVLLFSLSLSVVATTLYRVPHIVRKGGSQQYRSLLASIELLFAAASANALVLGSFVRDRGVKKPKFKYTSDDLESADRRMSEPHTSSSAAGGSRRPTLQRHWGSDEDLVRDLGLGVKPELRDVPEMCGPMFAPPSFSPAPLARRDSEAAEVVDMAEWQFPVRKGSKDERSDDSLLPNEHVTPPPPTRRGSLAPQKQHPKPVSFFDVGGLLDDEPPYGGLGRRSSSAATSRQGSFPLYSSPTAAAESVRRGSAALLQDLGGLLSLSSQSSGSKPGRKQSMGSRSALESIPQGASPVSGHKTTSSSGRARSVGAKDPSSTRDSPTRS